jgi:hypothetical protein
MEALDSKSARGDGIIWKNELKHLLDDIKSKMVNSIDPEKVMSTVTRHLTNLKEDLNERKTELGISPAIDKLITRLSEYESLSYSRLNSISEFLLAKITDAINSMSEKGLMGPNENSVFVKHLTNLFTGKADDVINPKTVIESLKDLKFKMEDYHE